MADWTAAFTYAFRTLRRQPTFVLVSVLTLALGIGANTAIFSVIKTVVLNPLPYEDPEKIAVLWEVNPDGNQGPVSVADLRRLEARGEDVRVDRGVSARRLLVQGHRRSAERARRCAPRRSCSPCSRATPRSGARSCRKKPSSAPIAWSCSATASGRARSARIAAIVGTHDSTRLGALHRRRRDAAGVRVPDQHQRRSVDAAGVRSEGHARRIAARAIADRGRPHGAAAVDRAAGAAGDQL